MPDSALFALVTLLALLVGFVWTHLRPLTAAELAALAAKRRKREVDAYFEFSGSVFSPDLAFKRGMTPKGRFYNFQGPLHHFPQLVASWLKGKKHEWMVVGMERSKEVSLVWANKGVDGTRVCLALPFDLLAGIAVSNWYASMLVLHNHPNASPEIYSCAQPSQVDLDASALRARTLNEYGINLVEFVCERGVAYKYRFSAAERFLPMDSFTGALERENGVSKRKNFSLHMERMF
jgi:hypothetical protein